METAPQQVARTDLITAVSRALDLVNPLINKHHLRTAYIAVGIARELPLPEKDVGVLFEAAALHDVGAMSLGERMAAMDFDYEDRKNGHAEAGFRYLDSCVLLKEAAPVVRFHHKSWEHGEGSEENGEDVPFLSQVLQLADRAEVLIRPDVFILNQTRDMADAILAGKNRRFHPDVVEAFQAVIGREAFCLDMVSENIGESLSRLRLNHKTRLDMDGLLDFSEFIASIVDMRDDFTASHSNGVAASAEVMARLMGFEEYECKMMRVAGLLHDIGKLSVPSMILNKEEGLSQSEFNLVKGHAYHTHKILGSIPELATVNEWAAYHHEHLDGSGYPFHLSAEDMSSGSLIMAVADKFTAMAEDRPYRKGLSKDDLLAEMSEMEKNRQIASEVVEILRCNYEYVDEARAKAQKQAMTKYVNVWKPQYPEPRAA